MMAWRAWRAASSHHITSHHAPVACPFCAVKCRAAGPTQRWRRSRRREGTGGWPRQPRCLLSPTAEGRSHSGRLSCQCHYGRHVPSKPRIHLIGAVPFQMMCCGARGRHTAENNAAHPHPCVRMSRASFQQRSYMYYMCYMYYMYYMYVDQAR